MQLRDDPNLILAYVEGELDGEALARFEQRCREDASLATLVRELQEDRAALRDLPQASPQTGTSPTQAALAQLERQLLLGDTDSPGVASVRAEPPGIYRLLRYATYGGLAAALGLTGVIVVNNLTGTPLEQRARELATRDTPPTLATSERQALAESRSNTDTGDPTPSAVTDLAVASEVLDDLETASSGLADVTQLSDSLAVADTPGDYGTDESLLADDREAVALMPSATRPAMNANELAFFDPDVNGLRHEGPGLPQAEATANAAMELAEEVDAELADTFALRKMGLARASELKVPESPPASTPTIAPTMSNAWTAVEYQWHAQAKASPDSSAALESAPSARDALPLGDRTAQEPQALGSMFAASEYESLGRSVEVIPARTRSQRPRSFRFFVWQDGPASIPIRTERWLDAAYWLGPIWPDR